MPAGKQPPTCCLLESLANGALVELLLCLDLHVTHALAGTLQRSSWILELFRIVEAQVHLP